MANSKYSHWPIFGESALPLRLAKVPIELPLAASERHRLLQPRLLQQALILTALRPLQLAQLLAQQIAHLLCEFVRPHLYQ